MKKIYLIRLLVLSLFWSQSLHAEDCGTQSPSSDRLIVMLNDSSEPDLWQSDQVHDLSFCISSRFSDLEPRIDRALREASLEWMKVANVDFKLADDLSCENKNRKVFFEILVAPRRAKYNARAFFPSYPVERRNIKVRTKYIKENSDREVRRVMIHELGHVLGFRHEQIHPDQGGTCPEIGEGFEPITDYDLLSIMHYPQCKKEYIKNYELSELDKWGASQAYPF